MNLAELRARLEAIEAERRAIHEAAGSASLTDDQQTAWDGLDTEENSVREQVAAAEEVEARAARVAESRARWGSVQVSSRQDPFAALNGPATTRQQLVGAIVQANEGRDIDGDNQRHFERLLNRHSRQTGGREWALELLGRSRPEYESGFSKLMMGRAELLTPEERTAMSSGSNTNGGYLLPTHLDPTLILTNSGSSNIIRGLARVVTLTNGETTWHGVTTAGVTASWDGELAEVSDDSPTLGSVSIATNVAQAFVQGSIAAFQDIANSLTSDVMMLFADARDRLEGAAHATGLGSSNQPKGIFTACNASTGVQVTSTTGATIGEVDIHALYRAVPVRWRKNAAWLTNPLYSLAVKRLGTAWSSSYSGDLTQAVADKWLNKPVYESDDAPTTQTTTALDNEIIFGDLQSAYTIVDKPGGMSVEYVPHAVQHERQPARRPARLFRVLADGCGCGQPGRAPAAGRQDQRLAQERKPLGLAATSCPRGLPRQPGLESNQLTEVLYGLTVSMAGRPSARSSKPSCKPECLRKCAGLVAGPDYQERKDHDEDSARSACQHGRPVRGVRARAGRARGAQPGPAVRRE
jgi:HK97 family phage major capsid protein